LAKSFTEHSPDRPEVGPCHFSDSPSRVVSARPAVTPYRHISLPTCFLLRFSTTVTPDHAIERLYDQQYAACGLRIRLPVGNDVSFIDAADLEPVIILSGSFSSPA